MAQNQFSDEDYSELRDVYQYLFWDRIMKRIEVFHEIRIGPGKDAYLERKETYTYTKDPIEYKGLVVEHELDTQKNKAIITVYTYKETKDDRDYLYTKRFPTEGGFYPLNLYSVPHIVIAVKEPTGANSTASGEAL